MIEVRGRYFLSKEAYLKLGSAVLKVPNVLFVETGEADSYPAGFEALLVRSPVTTGKTQIVAPQNEMIRGQRSASVGENIMTLPNIIPFSSLIEGIELTYSREGDAQAFIAVGRDESIRKELESVSSPLIMISSAPEIAKDPYDTALTICSARLSIGFSRLLYAPGVVTPQNLSLLLYAGIDLSDASATDMASLTGTAYVDGFAYGRESLDEGICTCEACRAGTADTALWHNRLQLLAELRRCRLAIRDGRLREYVEARAAVSPWNAEFLKYLDTVHYPLFERFAPNANTMISAVTEHSLRRPDILRYINRLEERYRPPALKIALLVPCSNRKPYHLSKSHRLFAEAVDAAENAGQVHIITVTSPIGVVPQELETVFPAAHYDIPVTGQWSMEEKERSTGMLMRFLGRGSYSLVISHLSDERDFINDALENSGTAYVDTSMGNTRSVESLARLRAAIDSTGRMPKPRWEDRMAGLLSNLAAFQFGGGGRALVEGARFSGRYPNLRIIKGGEQTGMLTAHRGVISLTLHGADAIRASVSDYVVEMDDFKLRGNLFAAGVREAGQSIRIGDEAIICREGLVQAVGVASMSAVEMRERRKGEAVHVRHARKE